MKPFVVTPTSVSALRSSYLRILAMDTQAGHDAMIASISSAFRDIKERINALEQQVNCLVCNEVETISSFDETFVITAARRVGGLAQSNTRNVVDQNSNGKPELIRNSTTSKDFHAAGSKKKLETDKRFVKSKLTRKRRLTARKTTAIKNEVTDVSKHVAKKKRPANSRMKSKRIKSMKREVAADSIPLNSRLARGKIVVNKMIIYDPLPEDNKNVRTFRVGRVLQVNRHSSTIVVHHYDTYNKNKMKMAGVRFRPAFSNDDPEAPMEVYCAKITRALVRKGYSKMFTSIPQKSVVLSFDNLLPRSSKIPPEIVSRYRTINSHSIVGEPKLMSNHVLFSGMSV